MTLSKLLMSFFVVSLAVPVVAEAQEREGYRVVINHEEQYAVWGAEMEVPSGWRAVGRPGSLRQVMGYIEEVWTDMRPLSVRKRMEEQRMDARRTTYLVVRGDEGRRGLPRGFYGYMLWPADLPLPDELTPTRMKGSLREATNYIEEVWTDMRPLSIRDRS